LIFQEPWRLQWWEFPRGLNFKGLHASQRGGVIIDFWWVPYFISKTVSEMLIIHGQIEVARLLIAVLEGEFKLLKHLVGTWKCLHY